MFSLWNELSPSQRIFFSALVIYAVLGSPTPESLGITELAIFALLALSVAPKFSSLTPSEYWLTGYGLSVPVIIGLTHGYDLNDMLRDIAPFLFLLMPVLYDYKRPQEARLLAWGAIAVGLVFSLRSLETFGANIMTPQEWLGTPPDLLYLANSPEVLFAALMLIGFGMRRSASTGARILCLALAVLPLIAMATLMQRASLLYMIGAGGMALTLLAWQRPKAALGAGAVLLAVFLLSFPFIHEIYRQLSFKTQMVGLNSRGAEWRAVFDHVSASPWNFLFGLGWGAQFEDPAVGNLRVRFTHSLLSALWLKTGLTGVFLFMIYIFTILKKSWNRLVDEKIYFYALAGPLLIGLCLYASYKSLGYGLLLLILARLSTEREKSKKLDDREAPVP